MCVKARCRVRRKMACTGLNRTAARYTTGCETDTDAMETVLWIFFKLCAGDDGTL